MDTRSTPPLVVRFDQVGRDDVDLVGGKNASLGEMVQHQSAAGVPVPDGFAVTAAAYREVLALNGLDQVVESLVRAPATERPVVAATLREVLATAALPTGLVADMTAAYRSLVGDGNAPVAVRSSATAEDLPTASFAGQHESFLGVEGVEDLLVAYRACVASLFTDRAVAYRDEHGFDHRRVALSVGVQHLVRSDLGAAGVLFTCDPDTGFPGVVVVDAVWGLGESVVGGQVEADRTMVLRQGGLSVLPTQVGSKQFRSVRGTDGRPQLVPNSPAVAAAPVLDVAELRVLATWAESVELHFGMPMDMEWAKDGADGSLWVVQARPETVESQVDLLRYDEVVVHGTGRLLVSGQAVGRSAAAGKVRVLSGPGDADRFSDGDVLVAELTDPDWVPVMRRAAAIVTDRGGGTSHAAIVSRELGVPAVLGCGDATSLLHDGQAVTVSCVDGGTGRVTEGAAAVEHRLHDLTSLPATHTKVMLNLADPSAAMRWWTLPAAGIGLARMEFLVAEQLGVHPMALAHPERVRDAAVRRAVAEHVGAEAEGPRWFVERLAAGLATLAAVAAPGRCIVRLSDFKTDEYARLLGGADFEPVESNPMLGWRGASRYADPGYRDGFALECAAVRRARSELGATNLAVMVPFCRTPAEGDGVLAVMADEGLARGSDGLEVWVMAEIPSNVVRAEEFAERFDGFSVGSNDLTQLTLGVDRESAELSARYGADDPAVLTLIADLVRRAHAVGRPVGFCGQAPSNDASYARLLVDMGVDSVSVTPDSFVEVARNVAVAEGVAVAA